MKGKAAGGGDLVLGIDIGTTAVKAALYDLAGREHFRTAADYPTRRGPGGIAEQDPADWLRLVSAALAGVAATGAGPRIAALGLTSHVNSHVFVDASGAALAPAIIWQDTRAAAEAAELDARIADADRLRWWGAPLPIDASHALSRMEWMVRRQPGLWDATAAVLSPKDFVLRHLAGTSASDPFSNIGLIGPDLAYIPDLLALVPGSAARLPPLARPESLAGTLRPGFGLPAIPLATGTMDALAGMLGTGMSGEGDAVYLSGTSEVLGIVSAAANPTPGVLVFPRWGDITLHAGPTQSGGASVAWFCAAFGLDPARMEAAAARAAPNPAGPLFLPHLAGERAPLWDPHARGAFLGLAANMGRPEMARAVYEGVAFSARLLMETLDTSAGLRPATLLCGGGGFGADLWNQIRADVLGRELRRLAVRDAGTLGAAALAAVASGLHPDLRAALRGIVRHDRTYAPDPAAARLYDELYALYRPAYEATREISLRLSQGAGNPGAGR